MAKAKKKARKGKKVSRKVSKKSKKDAAAKEERVSVIAEVRSMIRRKPGIETDEVRERLLKQFSKKEHKTLDAKKNPTGVAVLVARARGQLMRTGDVRKEDLPTATRPLGHRQMEFIPNAKSLAKTVGERKMKGKASKKKAKASSQKTKKGKGKSTAKKVAKKAVRKVAKKRKIARRRKKA